MQECKYASILSRNIFDPNLTWPKLFQTEHTLRLAHLPSFCELVQWEVNKRTIRRIFPSSITISPHRRLFPCTISLLYPPRYNAKGVLTKTEQTSMGELKLPAVTICPRFLHQIRMDDQIKLKQTRMDNHIKSNQVEIILTQESKYLVVDLLKISGDQYASGYFDPGLKSFNSLNLYQGQRRLRLARWRSKLKVLGRGAASVQVHQHQHFIRISACHQTQCRSSQYWSASIIQ